MKISRGATAELRRLSHFKLSRGLANESNNIIDYSYYFHTNNVPVIVTFSKARVLALSNEWKNYLKK